MRITLKHFFLPAVLLVAYQAVGPLGWGTVLAASQELNELDSSRLDDSTEPTAGSRIEYFALENSSKAVGHLTWRSFQRPEGTHFEIDTQFPMAGCRVLHTESEAGPVRLVWREVMAGAGRSVVLEERESNTEPLSGELEAAEPVLHSTSWSQAGVQRSKVLPGDAWYGFLGAAEHLRRGVPDSTDVSERVRLFDPLSGAWQSVELCPDVAQRDAELNGATDSIESASDGNTDSANTGRRAEMRNLQEDTLAGWFNFEGNELMEFGWQSGGLRARRIERVEWEELHRRLRLRAAGTVDSEG